MQRVKTSGTVPFASRDQAPASGTPQYHTDGAPGTQAATNVEGYFLNMVMDEMMSFIEAAGVTAVDTQWSQIWQVLFRAFAFLDTGAVNALVVNPPSMTWPFLSANLGFGTTIRIKPANTNTGPSTLNFAGVGALPIVKPGGSALTGGELVANRVTEFVHDGAGNWQMLTAVGVSGAVLAFTASGTYTAKASRVWARVWGGGGGGGGSNGAGSAGVGGAAGGYAEGVYSVVPGTGYAVTIGAGGTAGLGGAGLTNGGNGGTTSFASFCSATGGGGGIAGNGVVGSTVSVGGSGSGGNLINFGGLGGGFGYTVGGGAMEEGVGGTIPPFSVPPTGVATSAATGSSAFYQSVGGGSGVLGGGGAAGGGGLVMLVELP